MTIYLDFEKSVSVLDAKIKDLKSVEDNADSVDISDEISRLESKSVKELKDIYSKLTPAQKTQISRHPERPKCLDYINHLFTDFISLCGDRNFADDNAIIGGMCIFNNRPVLVLGHEKGHDLDSRLKHNFGMGRPEGYRKAVRLMELANRFNMPVITFIDTPGAYPGIGAEERGQAEAIAQATRACFSLDTPIISVIIGEGGSGGAVSLATADYVIMPQYSMYSVISPEGCASILWRDAASSKDAANALRLTADDLFKLNIIDEILQEPEGGAHRNPEVFIKTVGESLEKNLTRLELVPSDQIKKLREEKYINMTSVQ